MRLVYACRFTLNTADGLEQVVSSYRKWIVDNYLKRLGIVVKFELIQNGKSPDLPEHHSLSHKVYEMETDKVVCISWSSPDDKNHSLLWSNDIRVGQFKEECSVEHRISIEYVDYTVAPPKELYSKVGSPRVVRDICEKNTVHVGEMGEIKFKAKPYNLPRTKLQRLLDFLSSPVRKLPVVLLSPYSQGEPNRIDANCLARDLAGVAVVVCIKNTKITWDLSDELGRHLSCFNGAARIYWPGFSKDADPRSHQFFIGTRIEDGPDTALRDIERIIFTVAAFRFVPDNRISDLVCKVEAVERQKLLNEKKETGSDFYEEYERDLSKLYTANERIKELEAENANLKANQQVLMFEPIVPNETEDDIPSFKNVAEAVKAAETRFDNIELLGPAHKAAKKSPFKRPAEIYSLLSSLNEFVNDVWREGKEGSLREYLSEQGWGKRISDDISQSARGKYRSDYEFTYKGDKKLFERHITIGAGDPNFCASIHYILEKDEEKIVIAHIGKHLKNTKT